MMRGVTEGLADAILKETERLIIGIDCDGVLRNFSQSLVDVYAKYYPRDRVVPVEGQTEYPLHNYFPIGKDIYKFAFDTHAKDIYLKAYPYKGAYNFMRTLHKDNKVFIVTYQPNKAVEGFTKTWLEEQDIENDGILFIKRKQDTPIDVLLDDCVENLESLVGTRITPVCMDRPWNQEWKGKRVYKYDDFLRQIKAMK
jgi:5'(3')-deoxyribonucleotidase